jgi:hypothetical protein
VGVYPHFVKGLINAIARALAIFVAERPQCLVWKKQIHLEGMDITNQPISMDYPLMYSWLVHA